MRFKALSTVSTSTILFTAMMACDWESSMPNMLKAWSESYQTLFTHLPILADKLEGL